MPIPEAVEIVLQACEVLAEAHQLGIVHRDLKPANLFCVDDGDGEIKIKVLDFGISKVINLRPSLAGMSITRTSAVMGSPVYMSPEQMQTPRDVDARTDIWSAGIILYELLVGRVPFDGETLPEVCVKVATQTLPSIRRYRLDVPAGLEAVVRRCLEKERDARFRSVAEFAHALAPFAPSRARPSLDRIVRSAKGSEAIAPRRHDSDHPVLPRNIATSWWRTSPWSVPRWAGWRGPTGLIIAAALGATGIALLGVGLLPRETSPTSATSAVLVEPAPRRKQAEPPMIETAATARAFLVPSDLPLAEQAPVAPAPSTRAAPKTDAGKTAPSGGTCTLNFNSIPVAAVALDGERLGATPKIGFTAPVGTHLVTFEHAEYGTMTKSVTCENGETKAVSVRLSRAITTPLGEPDIETNPYR